MPTRLEQAPETGKSVQKRRLEPGFLAFLGRNRNDFRQRAGTKSFFSSLLYQRPIQLTSAQEREVMEAMAFGSLAKKFHAVQQASTMSS